MTRGARRWARGSWSVAAVLFAGMAFTTVPTPLYPIYAERRHLSTTALALVFALYPLGVMVSSLLLGHLSDAIGRRRALAAALALEIVAGIALSASPALGVLLAARVTCGLGVGLLTATASAQLADLDAAGRQGRVGRSDRFVVAATLGGFGGGALLSGVIATELAAPLRLPFVIFTAILIAALVAIPALPDPYVPEPPQAAGSRRPRSLALPLVGRRAFYAGCAGGFCAMALLTLFMSLVPTFLHTVLDSHSAILAGAVACLACVSAGFGQLVLGQLRGRALLRLSLALFPAAIACVVLAVAVKSFGLFLVSALIGGLGTGTLLRLSLATVEAVAPAGARGETFAAFYLVVYANATFPVVGLGLLTQAHGPLLAVCIYEGMVLSALAVAAIGMRGLHRPGTANPASVEIPSDQRCPDPVVPG